MANDTDNGGVDVRVECEVDIERLPQLRSVWNILIINPTRRTNFSNLFWEQKSTCFGQFLCPSSGVSHSTHNNRYTSMSYRLCWLLASGIRMDLPHPASKQSA